MWCILCKSTDIFNFHQDDTRPYLRCNTCKLVFVPAKYWLSEKDEKAEYDLHRNDPSDKGYQRFLSRLSKPLIARLGPHKKGLDFGCGPGPALYLLFEKEGHEIDLYDPFYYRDKSVFENNYDFICATEVVEHLKDPHQVFATLFTILNPRGWLGIMTKLVIDQQAFSTWHYKRDMTHICFYSRETFRVIASRYHAHIQFADKDVILLRKI
ncbi:methyltransferase domain-containing protein [candidate division KSB1 bacterium]|nr:methyltransferase domain-containing protein [candidate division KSB1 bacterium]